MVGIDYRRALAAGTIAFLLAGCHAQQPGQAASQTASQAEQANSTAAPEATAASMEAGTQYIARTDPKTHGIVFSIAANGLPGASIAKGGTSLDLHTYMHTGTNRVVVSWERQSKGGAGGLTIRRSTGRQVGVVVVTAAMPDKGQKTLVIVDK
jgi:hypothetical protein